MNRSPKVPKLFLILVFLQGFHSIEEYYGALWDKLPPATWLCGLISGDLRFGFLVINIGLFVFGILSWFFLVRTHHFLARFVLGFWVFIELVNGIGHPVWSLLQMDYRPGLITAPFLLVVVLRLIKAIYDGKAHSSES